MCVCVCVCERDSVWTMMIVMIEVMMVLMKMFILKGSEDHDE